MHEWALAESVLSAAVDAAKAQHLKTITDITVEVGELQQIEKEIFLFALTQLSTSLSPLLKKVKFHFKTQQSTLKCTVCGNEWTYQDMKRGLDEKEAEAIHFIPEVVFVHARCPKCKSPDFEIVKGRGVTLRTIKGRR